MDVPNTLATTTYYDIIATRVTIPYHTRKTWRDIMHNEFTAIIEKDGDWYIAYCPEVPGANGQGKTIEECKTSLAAAILLILEDRREDAMRGLPEDAIREIVAV